MENMMKTQLDELYEEFEIWWYESGLFMEAMYDNSIDKDEWFIDWLEKKGIFIDRMYGDIFVIEDIPEEEV